MYKKLSVILLTFIFLTGVISFAYAAVTTNPTEIPLSATFVGATTTGKFHYVSCRWADKIRSDHRVYFESREEAIDAGYVPCKVCKP